jgi:DNA-binding NarL/FixJ family response regulator
MRKGEQVRTLNLLQGGGEFPQPHRIRVLVGGGDALTRAGLRAVLHRHDDVEVIGEQGAVDHSAAVDVLLLKHPLNVLLELTQGRQPAVDLKHGPPVVMLTGSADEATLLAALRAGVRGVLREQSSEDELLSAVRAVADGNCYLCPSFTRTVTDWLTRASAPARVRDQRIVGGLTRREQQVLVLLGEAASNAEIATQLRISETTVRSHVHGILQKLGLRSRTEAALFGYRADLGVADAG